MVCFGLALQEALLVSQKNIVVNSLTLQ